MSVKYETMNYKVYGGRRGPERFRGIRPTSVLAILGLLTAQCSIQARPTDNPDPTSTFPRPRETFTPVPTAENIPGSSWQTDEIIAFGRALGVGGVGQAVDPLYASDSLARKFFDEDGLWLIVDGARTNQGAPLLTQVQVLPDGTRICLPNSPVLLFNPNVASGRDEMLFDANFIRYYGDREPQDIRFQTIPAVSLDGLAGNLVCVNTIAAPGRTNIFGVREGTVMTVLLDKVTGEIYGGFRSVFGANDILGFDQTTGRLTVNGQSVWFEGPGMLKLTPTPTETLTPTSRYEISPSDITREDRLYYTDVLGKRVPVTYGFSYSPRDFGPDPEGAKRWILSGILLEPPQLRETNLLEFRIGIPDASGGFSELNVLQRVLWYREPSNPRPEDLMYPMIRGPRSPAGGYNMYGKTGDTFPLEEALHIFEGMVGKQIVAELDFNESQAQMFAYLDNFAQVTCKGWYGCIDLAEELKGYYSETKGTFSDIRNSSYSRYDGKDFWGLVSLVFPRTPSD